MNKFDYEDQYDDELNGDEEIIWSDNLMNLVRCEDGMVITDIPGMDEPFIANLKDLVTLVEEPYYLDDYENKDFLKGFLPEILKIAEYKINLYESMDLKW